MNTKSNEWKRKTRGELSYITMMMQVDGYSLVVSILLSLVNRKEEYKKSLFQL